MHILVNKLGDHIVFDKGYETKNGYLICCKNEFVNEENNNRVEEKVSANKAHEILSHASLDTCKITSKELGWK